MRAEIKQFLKSSVLELVVYGGMVTAYFFGVLHFLAGWLLHLAQHQRKTYAIVALLLIVGQGVVLEMITTALLRWIREKTE